MPQIAPTPSGLFSSIITWMIGAVAARASRLGKTWPVGKGGSEIPGPFVMLLINRLRRIMPRFKQLVARAQDAALRQVEPPANRLKRECKPGKQAVYLPWQFGWVLQHGPELANYGKQLQYLANMPDMRALIEAEPGFGRLFRPLLNMLGAELPPHLQLPKRTRFYKLRPRKPREPKPRQAAWTLDYEKSKDTWTRASETLPPWYCPPQAAGAPPPPPLVAPKPHPPPVQQVPYAVLIKRFIGHGQR